MHPRSSASTFSELRGMSLRDYFAAKALTLLVDNEHEWSEERLAKNAYRLADAMLAARGAKR
jgi:hypothetical protein